MKHMKNSGPDWFRSVLTCTTWPQMPRAHGPFGKDRLTPAESRELRGVPLFINVQTRNAIRQAHELGGRALSYLSFMDLYVHTDGFENGTARVPWNPRQAQMLLIDKDGSFVNTHMDGTHRMWRYYVCCNTQEYVDAALNMVHQQMKMGADGIFIDNSGPRRPCYGHGLPVGYSESYRQVMAAIPHWKHPQRVDRMPPEQLFRAGEKPQYVHYPMIEALPRHRHLYPHQNHDYAYDRLLAKVRQAVRSYGPDKVVMVNGPLTPHADAAMRESFLYSWAWQGCNRTWAQAKRTTRAYLAKARKGQRLVALSYLGNTARTVEEDALHAFAASALLDHLWSDYSTVKGQLGKALRTLDLGQRLTALKKADAIEYAFFERGLVAINGSARAHAATVPASAALQGAPLRSLIDGKTLRAESGAYRLTLPPTSGRVFVLA